MKRIFTAAVLAILLVSTSAVARDIQEQDVGAGGPGIVEYTEEPKSEPGEELQIRYGGDYEGVLTRVIDAGHVEIDGEEMELLGVHAPRRYDDGAPRDCYSHESSRYLESRALGKRVTYRLEKPPDHTRLLGTKRIYLHLGHSMLNSELIRAGMAFVDTKPSYPEEEYFLELQQSARNRHAGLWHTCPVECNRHGRCSTKDW